MLLKYRTSLEGTKSRNSARDVKKFFLLSTLARLGSQSLRAFFLLNSAYATVEHTGFSRFILSGVRPTREFVCVQNKGTSLRNLVPYSKLANFSAFSSQRVECRKFITLSAQCVYNTMSVTESIMRFVGDSWDSCFACRPSVRLSRRHTHRDSPGGSMRRCQHTFRPDSK